MANLGYSINEVILKKALQMCNPDLHFDMGASLDIYHPKMEQWQGVFLRGRHITSMNRGDIPEFNVYRLQIVDGKQQAGELLQIGWRDTIERIIRQGVPGVSWTRLEILLGVHEKKFLGRVKELEKIDGYSRIGHVLTSTGDAAA